MAEVIQFPRRGETWTVHFKELHSFGEIGGLRLSLVFETSKEDSPFALVLLGGVDGFQILQTFDRVPDSMGPAKVAGDIIMRTLAAAHRSWTGQLSEPLMED